MIKRNSIMLLLFILLTLVACGGAANTAVSNTEAVADAPVGDASQTESLSLAPEVDVQTVADVKDRDDVLVIDVREQWEYDEKHIPDVTLIPLGTVPDRLNEIPTDQTVILTCRSGNRSGQAADFLRQQGYTNVHNMQGGIIAWEQAGLAVER